MARRAEPALRVRLSPSQDAVISGPGRVHLIHGSQVWYLGEREMKALAEEWQSVRGKAPPGSERLRASRAVDLGRIRH